MRQGAPKIKPEAICASFRDQFVPLHVRMIPEIQAALRPCFEWFHHLQFLGASQAFLPQYLQYECAYVAATQFVRDWVELLQADSLTYINRAVRNLRKHGIETNVLKQLTISPPNHIFNDIDGKKATLADLRNKLSHGKFRVVQKDAYAVLELGEFEGEDHKVNFRFLPNLLLGEVASVGWSLTHKWFEGVVSEAKALVTFRAVTAANAGAGTASSEA